MKPSLTAQIITDKLLKEDPFNMAVLLGRPNLEKLVDIVLLLQEKLRADSSGATVRGMAPAIYDPKLKRNRTLTDEELDNA